MIVRMTLFVAGVLLVAAAAGAADTTVSESANAPSVMTDGGKAPTSGTDTQSVRSRSDTRRDDDSEYYATPPDDASDDDARSERTHGHGDTARD